MKNYKPKIAITGYRGVIGSEFVKLYKKKFEFIFFKEDIRKKNLVKKWIKKNKPNFVIHLAAKVEVKDVNANKRLANEINYIGTKNLVEAIKFYKLKPWLFFASSSHVYNFSKHKITEKSKTNPITYYGSLKLKTENYLFKNKNKLNICIGRIFSFTHPKQNEKYFVPSIFSKLMKNKELDLKNLNKECRDFLSVDDICKAIKLLLDNKYEGTLNICSSKTINLGKIARYLIFKLYRKKINSKINNNVKINKLIGSNRKLKIIGFNPTKNIYQILDNFIKEKTNYLKK